MINPPSSTLNTVTPCRVVALSATGDISVLFEAASGGVHFVLDVNGYFE